MRRGAGTVRPDDRTLAGLLFFVGAVQFILALVVAEGALPEYSVSGNVISDLGIAPTAGLFNTSAFLLGLLTVGAAFFYDRVHGKRWLTALFVATGAGAMGVGLFPLTFLLVHGAAALTAFLIGGIAAIATSRVLRGPLRWVPVLMGIISLTALVLFAGGVSLGIGRGGMERMIAYPVLIWQAALGGHLMYPVPPATATPPRGPERS